MLHRRRALKVIAVAFVGGLALGGSSIAAQTAKSTTITLTVEGMT